MLENRQSENYQKRRYRIIKILSLIAVPLFILGTALLVFLFRKEIWSVFSSHEQFTHWVDSWGMAGPLVFIGLQILQVVVFVIPGEVPQIAGGFLFGISRGLLFSIVGIAIGSTVSFFLARFLGVPFVSALFSEKQVRKLTKILEAPRSTIAFFLFYLIPGIPKDIFCYVIGLTSMKFWIFMMISLVGRMPGLVGSIIIGDAAAGKKWILVGTLFFLAAVFFIAGLLFRDKIESWIERISATDQNIR